MFSLLMLTMSQWTYTGTMTTDRGTGLSVTVLTDNNILAAGGTGPLATCERYNPGTGVWTATGSLANARANPVAFRLQDARVLMTGNVAPSELFNPALGTWSTSGSMTSVRTFHAGAVMQDGRVLVACGVVGGAPVD